MTREIKEMTDQEAKEMIIRLKDVMANEFDISGQSINSFWQIVHQGARLFQERLQENQHPNVSYA